MRQLFENAGNPGFAKINDFFVATALDLTAGRVAGRDDESFLFRYPLHEGGDAHNVMNRIVGWMRQSRALDQEALYGDDWEKYNISFYRVQANPSFFYLIDYFHLEDFIFPDRSRGEAQNFDELMRMLDRDRMGEAMLGTLVRDFGMIARPHAPQPWRQGLRQCCHPGLENRVSPPQFAAEPALVAA